MRSDRDLGPVRLISLTDLEDLYRREHAAMVRLAFLQTGSMMRAEEVVHDAFLTVYERRNQIERPGAYLRQVVVNNCITLNRRRTTEGHKLEIVAAGSQLDVSLPTELDETWNRLEVLSPKQRAALVLRFYEDLTIDGIAEVMDERSGTVKSLIHRGLKKLRKELDQ